ncbi:hypothetical protein F5876DRAFT_78567 [Lentinula aff. lateritia]|uniref:Uncharacterized protein n=1 Tax=Lentinula aff. lateritia TaxID=2804960 RepID=A0ACC1TV59_9AGAR|nr:hypothetical protein F5876DRAFT_78567 [Lentinula aff. lateritia]
MLTLSLLRLLAAFLILPTLLAVSAAPLTGRTDLRTQVKKPDPRKLGKIMIQHSIFESPSFYFSHRNGFAPVPQNRKGTAAATGNIKPEIFIGRRLTLKDFWAKPIAIINFEKVKRNAVFLDMQTVVKGSSTWDYMAKAMEYLQANKGLEFEFQDQGEKTWKSLLETCSRKHEPKTSEVRSSTAGSGNGESVLQEKLPSTLSKTLIGEEAGNVTNAV